MKPNRVKNLTLCHYFTVKHSENTKTLNFELETIFAFLGNFYPLEKALNDNLHKKFSEILAIVTQKPPTYTIKDEGGRKIICGEKIP